MTSPILGIDLGTTNSAVAVLQDGDPILIPNALGQVLTPSVVALGADGAFQVGEGARARLATAPDASIAAFKRDMGTDLRHRLGGRSFSPPELSALVLRSLKADAEAWLGQPVEEAVITVPAYFGEAQRQATRAAGQIAGLRVERIINEPTAAALAYGLHALDEELRAVVLDLGGGTFDVTVLEILEGVIEIQSSAGDARLGGEDFDDALTERARQRLEGELGIALSQPLALARLRQACERLKRGLSQDSHASLALPALGSDSGPVDVELVLSREEAEACWAPLLDRLVGPVRRALSDADLAPRDIDAVLLVGGATRMPCVRALAARLFGRLPSTELDPDQAVARGAAVQAAIKEQNAAVDDLVVTDVAPFSLGVGVVQHIGRQQVQGMFSPIIERGTVVPCSRVQTYHTIQDHQVRLALDVFQGEHAQVSRNKKLGELKVRVPPAPRGEVSVDVRFTYDLNGLLEVETEVSSTGARSTLLLEQQPGTLSPKAIEVARKAMERLKIHPRGLLPNTVALDRAEALYAELRGDDRSWLAESIASFRAALDGQDPEAIEASRAALSHTVVSLAGGPG